MARMYVVAVSGGVDSVVLLDKLVNDQSIWSDEYPKAKLVVAHFDHGIRPNSAEDAEFVARLADQYGLEYQSIREELGADASEEVARHRRYAFLKSVGEANDATIVTAHHADDVAETIAINFQRGTGWRGLAVLAQPGVWRPLLEIRKKTLIEYARQKNLVWHEDMTNTDQVYLRNRIRQRLRPASDESIMYLSQLRHRQIILRRRIDLELQREMPSGPNYSRYLFIMVGENVALELLRHLFLTHTGNGLTIRQRQQILVAVKSANAGTRYEITTGVTLRFTRVDFIVEVTR